jgi:hypothetical protein
MSLSKIETFEHDVAAEVLKKEASFSQAASEENLIKEVTKEVTMPDEKSGSSIMLLVGVFVFVILMVGGYFGYTMFLATPEVAPVATTTKTPGKKDVTFGTTFPELAAPIGPYVTDYQKNQYGYSLSINDYSSVFSYIVKNEDDFIFSLSKVLPITLNETPTTTITYSDITISNQNMRLATFGSSTVAYAFLNTSVLIISTSTDGLSRIASGIIK